jgi:hypothetical protein
MLSFKASVKSDHSGPRSTSTWPSSRSLKRTSMA